jgi:hypothetical protein
MQADFKRENPEYKYDRARQKRITQELILSRTGRGQTRDIPIFPGSNSEALNCLFMLQGLAMGQSKCQPMYMNQTQASNEDANSTFGGFGDYTQFASDLFDTR